VLDFFWRNNLAWFYVNKPSAIFAQRPQTRQNFIISSVKNGAPPYYFRKTSSASLFLQKKIRFFSEEIRRCFICRNTETMLTHEKNTLAALFLQKKMKCLDVSSEKKSSTSSLFLENKNASVFWRDQEALHFLSRNTETMITEEMLVRLSISSGNMLIFFWRNDEVLDFFWSNNLSRTLRKHAISNSWISILRLDNSHYFFSD